MLVSFSNIHVGETYSRPALARLWGYASYQALARGVVTPRDDNKIILFVTKHKPELDFRQQAMSLTAIRLETAL